MLELNNNVHSFDAYGLVCSVPCATVRFFAVGKSDESCQAAGQQLISFQVAKAVI